MTLPDQATVVARYCGGPHDGMTGMVPLTDDGRPPAERRLQLLGELYAKNFRGKGQRHPLYACYRLKGFRGKTATYTFTGNEA